MTRFTSSTTAAATALVAAAVLFLALTARAAEGPDTTPLSAATLGQ